MTEITVKTVKLSQIKLNPDNPRNISAKEMKHLVKSLQDFPDMMKLREIIVDETMTILGGNMRYRALKQMGEKEVTAKIVKGLTPEQKREFVIKDNTDFGTFDFDMLANDWSDLPLVDWGLDLPEDWLTPTPVEGTADAEPQIDKAEELNKIWQVKTGDLWQIGEHRLLCGDSTVKADVDRVMQGEKADMVWTDPPYGVDYEGGAGNKVKREKLDGDASGDLYSPGLANLKHACKKSAPMYVWFADRGGKPVYDAIAEIGYEVRAMIVWNKLDAHYGAFMAQYMQKHEPCLYIADGNANWIGATNEVTVWDIKQPSRNENHPTEKPVELAIRAISNHNAPIVADFFGGSGTCMLASHNLNRKCRMIEKEPKFCAVILQRMHDAFPDLEIRRTK